LKLVSFTLIVKVNLRAVGIFSRTEARQIFIFFRDNFSGQFGVADADARARIERLGSERDAFARRMIVRIIRPGIL
jgi:hypothetical protein